MSYLDSQKDRLEVIGMCLEQYASMAHDDSLDTINPTFDAIDFLRDLRAYLAHYGTSFSHAANEAIRCTRQYPHTRPSQALVAELNEDLDEVRADERRAIAEREHRPHARVVPGKVVHEQLTREGKRSRRRRNRDRNRVPQVPQGELTVRQRYELMKRAS